MAKVIGFNADIAKAQADKKVEAQRAKSLKDAGRNVRFVRDSRPLTHNMVFPVLGLVGSRTGRTQA